MGWMMPKCGASSSSTDHHQYELDMMEYYNESEGYSRDRTAQMNEVEVNIISAQGINHHHVVHDVKKKLGRPWSVPPADSSNGIQRKSNNSQGSKADDIYTDHSGTPLESTCRDAAAYGYVAMAWIHPHKKMKTHVSTCHGRHDPTWNAKLHFWVPEELLREESSSALTIEIFECRRRRRRRRLVGTARVLLSRFVSRRGKGYEGAQSMALQIRGPASTGLLLSSAILNIGTMVSTNPPPPHHAYPLSTGCLHMPLHLSPPAAGHGPYPPTFPTKYPARLSSSIKEICRKSFSVSRDHHIHDPELHIPNRYSSARFSLDNSTSYTSQGSTLFELRSMETNYGSYEEGYDHEEEDEDEDEKEDELLDTAESAGSSIHNMEVIYQKLKQCNLSGGNNRNHRAGTGDGSDGKTNILGNACAESDGLAHKARGGLISLKSDRLAEALLQPDFRHDSYHSYVRRYQMENAAKIKEDKNMEMMLKGGLYGVVSCANPNEKRIIGRNALGCAIDGAEYAGVVMSGNLESEIRRRRRRRSSDEIKTKGKKGGLGAWSWAGLSRKGAKAPETHRHVGQEDLWRVR